MCSNYMRSNEKREFKKMFCVYRANLMSSVKQNCERFLSSEIRLFIYTVSFTIKTVEKLNSNKYKFLGQKKVGSWRTEEMKTVNQKEYQRFHVHFRSSVLSLHFSCFTNTKLNFTRGKLENSFHKLAFYVVSHRSS